MRSLKQKLIDVVGPEYVVDSFEDLYCYTYDASPFKPQTKEMPGIIVLPGSSQEISQI
ncbi:MAG: hypothetical protein KGZ96_12140 [Clostridia bacterium]|jgi:glycolate oxidase|nr:hypothetical protein [Clostridia bacterium]